LALRGMGWQRKIDLASRGLGGREKTDLMLWDLSCPDSNDLGGVEKQMVAGFDSSSRERWKRGAAKPRMEEHAKRALEPWVWNESRREPWKGDAAALRPQISFIVRHFILMQNFQIFLLERAPAMVVHLTLDVFLYGIDLRRIDRKRSIPRLPGEFQAPASLLFCKGWWICLSPFDDLADRIVPG
jgi:hypothetical protein